MSPAPSPLAVPAPPATGHFATLDWVVLAAYGLLLLASGWWFSRKPSGDTRDYFLGGKRMPVWAVAVSVIATSLSGATFIGGPQQAYDGNLTYLASNIGMVIGAFVVSWLLLPALYRIGAATPYELLQERFGTTGRRAAAAAFLIGRVMASGSRVYIIGIPAALIMFGEPGLTVANPTGIVPVWQVVSAIAAVTVIGIVYTLAGGVRSVIWTDVIQTAIFIGAIGAAMTLLLLRIPGGLVAATDVLASARLGDGTAKLTLIDTSVNFTSPYTLLSCVVAMTLMAVASYGLDQDLVQRMLTCRTAARGAVSVISANIVAIPIVAMFMAVGLLLYVFYARPDIMGASGPGYEVFDSSRVFLSFIMRELPPGLTGLMMAGLFAAGISSLNSGLNSMSSTVINDFYRAARPGRPEAHYLAAGRIGVVAWGLILGGFAMLCVTWQRAGGETLIDFALGVMTFAYAGLLGVFATAVLTRRGNTASAVAALGSGFLAVFTMNRGAMSLVLDSEAAARSLPPLAAAWALAFPWKLTIGAAIAFLVCAAGAPPRATPEPR